MLQSPRFVFCFLPHAVWNKSWAQKGALRVHVVPLWWGWGGQGDRATWGCSSCCCCCCPHWSCLRAPLWLCWAESPSAGLCCSQVAANLSSPTNWAPSKVKLTTGTLLGLGTPISLTRGQLGLHPVADCSVPVCEFCGNSRLLQHILSIFLPVTEVFFAWKERKGKWTDFGGCFFLSQMRGSGFFHDDFF